MSMFQWKEKKRIETVHINIDRKVQENSQPGQMVLSRTGQRGKRERLLSEALKGSCEGRGDPFLFLGVLGFKYPQWDAHSRISGTWC